ncbi:4'-phosphopantetheinyl transferase family protein [Streptomyces albidochromogenes]|uniref:4'-phosphopantetheinyl transferase family protein n=1 Tax=Streptomyces albidochromogenes TaxID=329524 RepID=UPI001FCC89DE|nr:4'-phosphopantetheinyl transferase superfamily protein [Streptomyces albidochromogenes]
MNATVMYEPVAAVFEEPAAFAPPQPSGQGGDAAPVLWSVDAEVQADAAMRLAGGVLDDGEKERAAAFVREADRRCYVTAHVALRAMLGACLGLAPGAVRLHREPCVSCGGPHGRPATADGPVHFSLSHSGSVALIACAAVPVGVDVEAVPRPGVVNEVARELHPRERAELTALPEAARSAAFARVWARKEAYLKGLGVGLARGLSLDYLGTGPAADRPPGWRVADVAAPNGFAAAVALRTGPASVPGARVAPAPGTP